MQTEMTVEKLDSATAVAVIHGSLTMGTNLKTIDHNLQALVEGGVSRLVVDMTACPYSDSAGLGVLMHTFGLLQEGGGAMRLCAVSDRVASLLKMTRTDAMLGCDVDRETSVAALNAEAS
jgi:anti-sigma B factor antagonist